MDSLNFVNLIQAATVGASILGSLLLWRKGPFHGIALLLALIAFASSINILEESGISRDIYIISPIFIMLLGPANYLAAKHIIDEKFETSDWIHILPVAPVLLFTSHVTAVIAIGTIWRLAYAYFTASLLIKYKRTLEEERSDSNEFSYNWLVWIVLATASFNLADLVRLNSQPLIPFELNVIGQGINNSFWLVVVMIITVKLLEQKRLPKPIKVNQRVTDKEPLAENYLSTFNELNTLVDDNQWFLKPRLTLTDVSELTGLQTRDISRAINTVANKSFNDYINEYRVKHICQALDAGSPHSLTRLYTDAGFSSKASFNKVFKEYAGITPSAYKAQAEV
ncbi:MAG: AraC-like DNA-binding protein [Gammaproteobacteria bacterium]|jgi:AraC-like DNA-binding protein